MSRVSNALLGSRSRCPPDRASSQQAIQWLTHPPATRDRAWEERLHAALWQAAATLPDGALLDSREGLPCLRLDLLGAAESAPAAVLETCLARHVDSLTRMGCGAAFYLDPDQPPASPTLMLGVGTLLSLLDEHAATRRQGTAHAATPLTLAAALPARAARGWHRHLALEWGIHEARAALVPWRVGGRAPVCLAINHTAQELALDAASAARFLAQLDWFLPPGRRAGFRPPGMPGADMVPLRQLFEETRPPSP